MTGEDVAPSKTFTTDPLASNSPICFYILLHNLSTVSTGTELTAKTRCCEGLPSSSAGFLQIAAQGGNLGAQLVGTQLITPGEGDGEGKFELFELVIAFLLGMAA